MKLTSYNDVSDDALPPYQSLYPILKTTLIKPSASDKVVYKQHVKHLHTKEL